MKKFILSLILILCLTAQGWGADLPGRATYIVDPTQSDQGVQGNLQTIAAYLTSIGTTKNATLYFRHTGLSDTTQYVVTTAVDFTTYPYIYLYFEQGAVLAGAGNVTLYSSMNVMKGPTQDIYDGTGTLAYYDLDWYVGDLNTFTGSTIADDSTVKTALQALETAVELAAALDAELTALAGLTSAANTLPYFTGAGTAGTITSSANMVSLLGSADYATARTNLGLAIGTDVQAYDADTADIAAGISGLVLGAGDGNGYSAASADSDYAAARFTKGLTMGSFTNGDTSPDVTAGGTGIAGNDHFWQTANDGATVIADFDDGDNHDEFAAGDWFVLKLDDAYTTIDFASTYIKGNAGVDLTGHADYPMMLLFIWDGSAWNCENVNSGMSTPITMGISNLKLPTAADPDLTTEGQVAQDSDGANVTNDEVLRGSDGTNQFAWARKLTCIHATAIKPQDWADAARDLFVIWENTTGMTFTVVSWSGKSGTDDTTLAIEEFDGDGQNGATVDAVEIATNGTGLFYGSDTTISAGTVEAGHILSLDFDDTDDPAWVKMTICGWFDANVD